MARTVSAEDFQKLLKQIVAKNTRWDDVAAQYAMDAVDKHEGPEADNAMWMARVYLARKNTANTFGKEVIDLLNQWFDGLPVE